MNQRLEDILIEVGQEFKAGRANCAESVLLGISRYFGWKSDCIPRIATPFGGGFGGTQHTCGAFSGGLMALGLRYGREVGGDKGPSYQRAQALVAWFQQQYGALDCRTLVGDMAEPSFRQPGGKHETCCERLVPAVCRYLVAELEGDVQGDLP